MKPKTQIPWENYIMRKYGNTIRKAIELTAVPNVLAQLRAKARAEKHIPATFSAPVGVVGKC